MKLFRFTNVQIATVQIAARDAAHATHVLLNALEQCLGYFPKVTYSVESAGMLDGSPEQLEAMFGEHRAGIIRYDNGWKLQPVAGGGDLLSD